MPQWISLGEREGYWVPLPSDAVMEYVQSKAGATYSWSLKPTGASVPVVLDINDPYRNWNYMGQMSAGLAPGVYMDTRTQGEVDADGKLLVTAMVSIPAVGVSAPTLGVGRVLVGSVVGGGFDAAGQLTNENNGEYRYGQTFINAVTGGLSFPMFGKNYVINSGVASTVFGVNTAVTNWIHDRNDDVYAQMGYGAVFAYGGTLLGKASSDVASVSGYISPVIYTKPINTGFPILLQGSLNPMPGYIGDGVSTIVGGVPTYAPQWFSQ